MTGPAHTLVPYLTADVLAARVRELAATIHAEHSGQPLLAVGVLKGGFVFLSDLVRAMPDQDLEIDFIAAHSYAGTESTGEVRVTHDLSKPIEGRHVLIVEDIIDTGLTLRRLREMLSLRKPASLRIVCLLDKPSRRKVEMEADYVGFTIPDRFVVGYGLDYDGRYRQLPYVAEVVHQDAP